MKQPAVRRCIVLPAFGAEDVHPATLNAGGAEHRIELRAIDHRRVHGLARRERDDEEVRAAVDFLRRRAGIERLDADRGRQRTAVGDRFAERGFQLRHPRKGEPAVLPFQIDIGRPDAEAERGMREARLEGAGMREREGGADRRMARKRGLGGSREDADAVVGARLLGRKHERILGEVRLARHRLHRIGVEATRLDEHKQLIALQPAIGEHVEVDVAIRPAVGRLRM